MIHGCVTLDEVFAAAFVRAASLVPETSGYLVLALGDATSRLPLAVEGRRVLLTTEGTVGITKRGEILPNKQAAQGFRAILAQLLGVATGTAMPGLSAAARPREESDRGVDAVVEEIEAALIPVNRSAARRALARLARETIKARESGRLDPPSTRPKPAPAAVAPPLVVTPPPGYIAPEPTKDTLPPPTAARAGAEHVADEATTPPPHEPRDPTPTMLGMGPVEMLEPEQQTTLDVTTAEHPAESTLEPPPRILPAAQPAAPEPRARSVPASATCTPARPTRADDLLARFGASCVDEDGIREAAACLRRIAGIDLTAPPARVQIGPPAPPPPPLPGAVDATAIGGERPETPRVRRRLDIMSAGVGLTLVVLAAAFAGGAAVRLRPDLFGSLPHLAAPAIAPVERAAPPPAASVEPTGAASYGERLGATRAERGSGQRAR